MPRLYRPHIPIEVRCRVALGQLGEKDPHRVIEAHRADRAASYLVGVAGCLPGRSLGRLLQTLLNRLAENFGCNFADLRLDHDPPLASRPRFRRGLGRKTYYQPAANDPAHLFYRPHGPEFDGSHLIKTNVRGDHGQFPDRVLIKRERKRRRNRKDATRSKSSVFPKRSSQIKQITKKRHFTFSTDKSKPKRKSAAFRQFERRFDRGDPATIDKRATAAVAKLRSASRWPPRGSRKLRSKQ